jgi:hypothetical protein
MVRIEIWDENISNLSMTQIIAQKDDGGKQDRAFAKSALLSF